MTTNRNRWFCVDRAPVGHSYSIHYDHIWERDKRMPDLAIALPPSDDRTLDQMIADFEAGKR